MTTAENIAAYMAALAEGEIVSAKELLHLGSRAAIDQALSRLAKRGELLRVGRGLYTRQVETRFGVRPPKPGALIEAIAARTGETLATNGAAEANQLGLTTQNPIELVYLTSGRTRAIQLGKQRVLLRHAPGWQLRAKGSRAGAAMRALAWIGPNGIEEKVAALCVSLNEEERSELVALRASAPGWLAEALSPLAARA